MESEFANLSRLRSQYPHGWLRLLNWPANNLSSADVVDIENDCAFILPVRRNVPPDMQRNFERLRKAAPEAVLRAAEKAYRKGCSDGAKFILSHAEGDLALSLAHAWLGVYAEFARQLGGKLHRDGAIRLTQRKSGVRQDVIRDLWRQIVPPDVKLSRGSRSVSKGKKPVEDIKKSVGPKRAKIIRLNGEFVLPHLAGLIFNSGIASDLAPEFQPVNGIDS